MKQTAVEWLENEFQEIFKEWGGLDTLWIKRFEQAKAMEKEQHKISFNAGYDKSSYKHDLEYGGIEYWEEEPKEFEQYYNETYGK